MKLTDIIQKTAAACLAVLATCCGGAPPENAEEAQTEVEEVKTSPEDLWAIGVAQFGWSPERMPIDATASEILSRLEEDERLKDLWDGIGYGDNRTRDSIGYSR